MKCTFFILFLVSVLALWVRVFRLDGTLLYSDQAFCWRVATSSTLDELLTRAAGDTHPPGYFLVLREWVSMAGSTPFALRLLSTIVGVLSVWAMFGLCRYALSLDKGNEKFDGSANLGALFAASVMAIHYVHIEASRLARMYALGILLAIVTSWLLIVCINNTRNLLWWAIYGVAIAFFGYTHSYAIFTVAAHGVYLGSILVSRGMRDHSFQFRIVTGYTIALAVALGLYAPWLSRLMAQAKRVHVDFWIPPLSFARIEQLFLSWSTGIGYWDGTEFGAHVGIHVPTVFILGILTLVVLEILLVWFVVRSDSAGLFFFALACIPWLLAIGTSQLLDRSIVLPRYLAFAHIGLIGMVAVAFARLPVMWMRLIFAVLVLCPIAYGAWLHIRTFPPGPPAIVGAVKCLVDEHQNGDIVFTSRPKRLLELRYYASQAGLDNLQICCPIERPTNGGHQNLVSALSASETRHAETLPHEINRIWIAGTQDGFGVPGWDDFSGEWRRKMTNTYRAADDLEEPSYTLILYERASN